MIESFSASMSRIFYSFSVVRVESTNI